ncbi:response regulator containing a CheY-like receiver domain and an HTH DNA-binding domain [Opitutaceae bacterium TAV1]|nr:LuxR family transcriptional regulator [Opitutaceae bacterium TAV5]EIP98110.1 response regulator containing a CheY-like receiver domain and an HTH DNA-binding domain [Opitutaceae bacterium TAV1]
MTAGPLSASGAPRRVRVLVVEDLTMFRAFLVKWLAGRPRFELAGAAGSGEEAVPLVASTRPDVLLVDLHLTGMDGLEFVRAARQSRPQVRALVLSSLVDPLALTRVRESGVEGYVEKDAEPELLAEALDAVADGRRFYSARFGETLAREGAKAEAVGKILSRREQEVLMHVLAGRTSREIGELIGLSQRTVDFHRANIMGKLGATNVADLVANARRHGFGSP